jgi:hypothetical protein
VDQSGFFGDGNEPLRRDHAMCSVTVTLPSFAKMSTCQA